MNKRVEHASIKLNNTATHVKLINTKGASSLVEFEEDGITRRVYVPAGSVKDDLVLTVIISRGIPYGHPWEELDFTVGGAALSEAMHKADLWTIEDVMKNPKKLRLAIQSTITSQMSEILTIAYGEKKGVNEHGQ
jgi:hypothetical protein